MTTRERFQAVLNGEKPDRLPVWEQSHWWSQTVRAWREQGLPADLDQQGIFRYWDLDLFYHFWLRPLAEDCPKPAVYGHGIMETEEDYERLLPFLYPDKLLDDLTAELKKWRPLHERGEAAVWFSLDGFFWFPRQLLGIERHLYAFYDQPELMHRINRDLTAYYLKAMDRITDVLVPEFMAVGEDMSYNHGPMLSKELFDEFLAPYYRILVPAIRQAGTRVMVDSDGQLEPMIPWLLEVGVEGVQPLERQSGVDVARIRRQYPEFLMTGGFDKLAMDRGEAAIRAEFERLLPVMRSGRFIPSVDHQTPPNVTMEMYRQYLELFREYARKAVE